MYKRLNASRDKYSLQLLHKKQRSLQYRNAVLLKADAENL